MEIGNVRLASIETEMRQSYLDYAMSVIVQRALPDARDGLKPVHRRVLYAMSEMGLRSNTRYRKSAGIVGEVLKNYHPHGDTAVYDTLVRMAQDFNLRYPLVDGQGNFGSVDGDGAAAMRYTEARLTAISDELLADIDKNTVEFIPNYDASSEEPRVLPARLPNLLLNGSTGIAVGMATNIPPHNLNELCDAITLLDRQPRRHDRGPDGGRHRPGLPDRRHDPRPRRDQVRLCHRARPHRGPRQGLRRGISRAAAATRSSSPSCPTRSTRPPCWSESPSMVREGKLDGISDLRDESDRTGMRAIIELKRDAQPMKVLNNLFKHTAAAVELRRQHAGAGRARHPAARR